MFISEFIFGSNNTGLFNASRPALHETSLPLRGTSLVPISPPTETPTQKHMKLLKDHVCRELATVTHFSCCVKLSLSHVCEINPTSEIAKLMWV